MDDSIKAAIIESIKSNSVFSSSLAHAIVRDREALKLVIERLEPDEIGRIIAKEVIRGADQLKRHNYSPWFAQFFNQIKAETVKLVADEMREDILKSTKSV
jgi:hypothetical protein